MKAMRVATLVIACVALSAPATAEVWVELSPAGPKPSARDNGATIYDPVAHRVILFGGRTGASKLNDVWSYDLVLGTWTDITPALGPAPTPRFTQNGVYDPVGHRMIIWSGQGSPHLFNDVWAFDLNTHTWSEFTPPDPKPNIRYGTAAVFDPVDRDLVTFAGFTNQGRFDDTWRFDVDASGWTEVTQLSFPVERCLHSAAYDILNRRMIMYGGQTGGALALDDIWILDLATDSWADVTPAVRPSGRFFVGMDYDSSRHRVLVQGGYMQSGATDEVWAFDLDSQSWSELQPGGVGPEARSGAMATYIVTEDRLLLLGGYTLDWVDEFWSLELSPDGEITMPWSILGEGDSFSWPVPANVDWVRGDLDSVDNYDFDLSSSETYATSITDGSVPDPGSGYYYVVRFQGADGSWQTTAGAEPDRDVELP